MKYTAKLPNKNHNVSSEHPLREFCILVSGACLILLVLYWVLGKSVDLLVDNMPPMAEQMIHHQVNDYVGYNFRLEYTSPPQNIRALINGLEECAGLDYPVSIHWREDEEVNAFALPGGHIVLLSGLVGKLNSENGLAFVLAHELAHFNNRDHLRAMGRSVVMVALSALVGIDNAKVLDFLAPVSQFEVAQFSQQRESNADEIALSIVNCHFGHVGGATEFFNIMTDQEAKDLSSWGGYFASHPHSQARIDFVDKLIKQHGYIVDEVIPIRLNNFPPSED